MVCFELYFLHNFSMCLLPCPDLLIVQQYVHPPWFTTRTTLVVGILLLSFIVQINSKSQFKVFTNWRLTSWRPYSLFKCFKGTTGNFVHLQFDMLGYFCFPEYNNDLVDTPSKNRLVLRIKAGINLVLCWVYLIVR